jgi:hypothetical protein
MTRATAGTTIERLADHLLPGADDGPMVRDLVAWLASSARFRTFAELHRDKIRKKLRGATDEEARRDVRAELSVAHALLADRRIELAFEAYGSGRGGPDFGVTYRGERAFNLEVTRLRRPPSVASDTRVLLTKLRQLPPSVPNAVLIAFDGDDAAALDIAEATRLLRARADAKDEAFFTARGFAGTRAFYERYLRLGAVLGWCEGAEGEGRASLWINRSARIPLPERAQRACLASLRGG